MRKLPIFAALLGFATIFAFQNCSTSSLPSLDDSSVATASIQQLALSVTSPSMDPGTNQLISGSGGQLPYSYQVTNGGCTVGMSTGVLQAPAAGGTTCELMVTDARQVTAINSVSVPLPVTQPSITPAPTPAPAPVCSVQPVTKGPGAGASVNYWGNAACANSCTGPFGAGARCAGTCSIQGDRGWMYCSSCVKDEEVCQ